MDQSNDTNIAADAIRAAHGDDDRPTVRHRFPVMGTIANISIVGGTKNMLADLERMAFHLESLWSRFLPDSDISRINNAEGAPVEVNPLTAKLVTEMLSAMTLTDGEFDPTILPKLVADGYATSRVDPSRITTLPASARWPVDASTAQVTDNVVTLPLGMTLDSGGLGKGAAADILVNLAMRLGALGAMAEMGGDIRVKGASPDGSQWRIGINDPFVDGRTFDAVSISDGAVASSSTLLRTWEKDGETVNHLIDTHTGSSMSSGVVAVSVIAPSASLAEALTKPGFTRPDFLRWIDTRGAAGLVVTSDGMFARSANWMQYQ